MSLLNNNKVLSKTVFVADNAKIHKSKFFWEHISTRAKFVFNAVYSPELNPIELCWSKWKREVKRGGSISNPDELMFRIHRAASTITKENCLNWFQNSLKNYRYCFLLQRFY